MTTRTSAVLSPRARELLRADLDSVARRTSRLFAGLLAIQWAAAVVLALVATPYSWAGATRVVHPHVWAAVVLGGVVVAYPIWLAVVRPTRRVTRHVVAFAQMGIGAILIHVTNGRLETHFHVFGSLAFLSFYRDWRVLVTASVYVGADHIVRGIVCPWSLYGVPGGAEWRWVEHSAWVVFEDAFLVVAVAQSVREMAGAAADRARLERTNADIEQAVRDRTADLLARTEQLREREAALREGEARHRSIIESATDCIITVDADDRVIEFNRAAERTFGYTRDEAVGAEFTRLVVPVRHYADRDDGLAKVLATGTNPVFGRRLVGLPAVRKDGTEFPVEATLVPTELAGRPVFTAFLRDITAELAADASRRAAEAELHRAKESAEAADRAKSQFLANMSHEFRTPMAAIVGYAEMLLDPRLGVDERVRTLQAVIRNGRHLVILINDILDLSKIESGRMSFEHVPVGLRRVVAEAFSVAGVAAQEKHLDLSVVPVGRLPHAITTDPTRLRQMLDNLLSNAVKFTAAGKRVEVRLRVADGPGPGSRLVIEVEDQGIGIAAHVLPRLFTPFSQADTSTTRQFGGTGLGLSICKRLAEHLGGAITVRSTPGVGSCFGIVLPLAAADLGDMIDEEDFVRESQSVRVRPSGTTARLTGRVLLTDDNPDNRTIIRFFLERAGLAVEEAENGRVAVEKALAGEFDVVLMDMQMPELDGYAATSLLRQKGFERSVVALTAHAMTGDEEKCLRAGCNAYLTKPVEPDRLLAVVARQIPSRSWVVKYNQTVRRLPPAPPPLPARGKPDAVARYRKSLPDKVQALTVALAAGDRDDLTAQAHKLAGSAGMYGFPLVTDAARKLEEGCRAEADIGVLGGLIADVAASCRAAQELAPA